MKEAYGSASKESACKAEDLVWFLGWEDPLDKGKATDSSILDWRIPWSKKWLSDFHFPEGAMMKTDKLERSSDCDSQALALSSNKVGKVFM